MNLIKRICKICLIQHLYQNHLDFLKLMAMLKETLYNFRLMISIMLLSLFRIIGRNNIILYLFQK